VAIFEAAVDTEIMKRGKRWRAQSAICVWRIGGSPREAETLETAVAELKTFGKRDKIG